jgi:2-polyprenyl-3-methyl-5-hydroxy-6-metoxy-1,4-benzoquinol methylase
MEDIKFCPVCNGQQFELFLECIDFTVTNEHFTIYNCKNCGFKFTNPRPSAVEIGKYYESEDYVSHSNTNEGLVNKLYHFVKKRAIQQKIKLVESLEPISKEILDIGCGTGAFLQSIEDSGWTSKGIEPSEKARNYCLAHGLNVSEEDFLKQTNETYSIITMWHVLEHVHDLNTRLKEIQKLLKPGGFAIIAVPNYKSADARKYGRLWAAYDVPRHLYHFSEDTIKSLFLKHRLSFVKSIPMKMDAFYVSMLSEKYKKSFLQYPKAFLSGLTSNLSAGANPEKYSSVIYIFRK